MYFSPVLYPLTPSPVQKAEQGAFFDGVRLSYAGPLGEHSVRRNEVREASRSSHPHTIEKSLQRSGSYVTPGQTAMGGRTHD